MVNHILTVRGRKASVTPRTLVQGTVGQDTLTLDLDSEWNGLNVTVTFVAATTEITPVLTANVCEIPHEALVDSGEIDVFVLGTRDGKAMRHASLEHKMVVKKSNMSDGSTTADPSISAYRQAYDDAVKATEAANSAAGTAGSTAAEMAKLNKRYDTQISQQATAFSTDQIQRANDFYTAQTQRANDFSTAQTQRAHDFDSAMQGYENAFNEAEGERASAETKRDEAEKKRGKAEEQRAQDSKTRLEELAQAKINAETATGEANTARDEAKKAATDATSAAGKATDAAILAETAKTNANTAAEEAKSAAAKAETAASSANSAAESASSAAVTAGSAASTAGRAADEADSAATKANASAEKADAATAKANEATVAATNAATKANEVESKLTGNVLKGKVKETFVHVDDAFPSSLLAIEIEGDCRQDGTPSPDNPVPIEVIENPTVNVTGRNLLDCDRGINECFVKNADGTYTLTKVSKSNRFSGAIPCRVLKGSKIYVSGAHTLASTPNCVSMLLAFDDGTSSTIPFISEERTVVVAKAGLTSIKLYVEGTVANGASFTFAPQVEYGTKATTYAPYVGTSQSFTLPPEHPYLAKLPDGTADEIVVDRDGNVELVARVWRGFDFKTLYEEKAGGADCELSLRVPSDVPYRTGSSISNVAKQGDVNAVEPVDGAVIKGDYVRFTRPDTVKDNATAIEYLRSIGAEFYAVMTAEQTYSLGKVTVPSLSESVSNVWTDAEVTPKTGIEYTRDVNIVVANLESAIASITQG